MAIAGKLRLPATETGFLVSRDALTRRDNQWLIFTIEDGQAQEIAVDLVSDGGEMVAINHPSLFPGQEIVLRGGDGLQDGAKVKIVKRLGK
jgi:multidrug efflux pump subunit AcrA (membrane-fusion protein)